MEQKYKGMKKNCFWRHGPYKTIKIIEHTYDGKNPIKLPNGLKNLHFRSDTLRKNYNVKRIFVIQQCMTCGKLIVRGSYNGCVKS